MIKPCHNSYIYLALERCVSSCDFEIEYSERKHCHTVYNDKDSLVCVVLNVVYAQCYSLKPCYNKCIDMASLQYVFGCEHENQSSKRKICHNVYIGKVFLQSVYPNGKLDH